MEFMQQLNERRPAEMNAALHALRKHQKEISLNLKAASAQRWSSNWAWLPCSNNNNTLPYKDGVCVCVLSMLTSRQ